MSIHSTNRILYDSDGDGVPELDISADVTSDITGSYGNFGTSDVDYLADAGTCRFQLDNSDGAYTELQIGRRVDVWVSDGVYDRLVFSGKIAPSKIDPRFWDEQRVSVTLDDWIKIANSNEVENIQVLSSTTADEALDLLLDTMARPPVYRDFEEGVEPLPDVFDGLSKGSNYYSEIDRIVKSELAHCYLRFRGNAYGETLRLENQHSRGMLTPLTPIPIDDEDAGLLKYHGSAGAFGYLKYHGAGGTSGRIKISEHQDASFDRLHSDADWVRGDRIVNRFTTTDVSRIFDASPVNLFAFAGRGDQLMSLGTGITTSISGTYSNPNDRGTLISASSVITPVATTDYLFNSAVDGSGTDLTANIVILDFQYGAGNWIAWIKNLGAPAYCIKWNVRGLGVYKNSNTDYTARNEQSIDEIGEEQKESVKREYAADRNTSKTLADGIVALRRLPTNNMRTASFVVSSQKLMRAFLALDLGSKVRILEGKPAHDGKFYIRGIRFTLRLGGSISFVWALEEAIETLAEPIVVGAPTVESINAIDFGILPYLANLPSFSYSFWIRRDNALVDTYFSIITRQVDLGSGRRGNGIITDADGKIYFQSYKTPTDGEWVTTNVVLSNADQWYHVVLTYDNTSATADPVIYVNGSSVAVTEGSTPSGTSDDDSDCPLILFNAGPNPANPGERYADATAGFSLKDVRVYRGILTTAQVTELASGEDDYTTVPDGLLFQGIYAPSAFLGEFVNDPIAEDDFVLDAVHRAAGIPYNIDAPDTSRMLYGEAL